MTDSLIMRRIDYKIMRKKAEEKMRDKTADLRPSDIERLQLTVSKCLEAEAGLSAMQAEKIEKELRVKYPPGGKYEYGAKTTTPPELLVWC